MKMSNLIVNSVIGVGCNMTSRSSFRKNVIGVDVVIDSAYDDIKKVADNIEALLSLQQNISNLQGDFLGKFAVAPTTGLSGGPLESGDHYLNTVDNLLYVRLVDGWTFQAIFYDPDDLDNAIANGAYNVWVVYSDDNVGTNISLQPTGRTWMGVANNQSTNTPIITDPGIFTWMRFKGTDGVIGSTAYMHIAFADSADGLTNFNTVAGSHIGTLGNNTLTPSVTPGDYTWNKLQGETGAPGVGVPGPAGLIDIELPTAPTGLAAHTNANSVRIEWDLPPYSGHGHSKIYRTTWDGINVVNFSETFLVAESGADFTDIALLSNQDYLYWVRHVNLDGVESTLSLAGAGLPVVTKKSFKDDFDWVDTAHLKSSIQTRLDNIDTTVIDGEFGVLGAYDALKVSTDAVSVAQGVLTALLGDNGSGLTMAHNDLQAEFSLLETLVGDVNSGIFSSVITLQAASDDFALKFTALGTYDGPGNTFSTINDLLATTSENAVAVTALVSSINTSNINLMPNFNFEGSFIDHLVGGRIDTLVAQSGANSLIMDSGVAFTPIWSQYLSDGFPEFLEAQQYTIGVWALNTNTTPRTLQYPNVGGAGYGVLIIPANTTSWTWFTTQFTIPADFITGNDANGDFWSLQMIDATTWDGALNLDRVVLIRGSHVLDGSETFTTNEAAFVSASAIDSLETRVTDSEGNISAQATQLVSLGTWDGMNFANIESLITSRDGVEAHFVVKTDVNGHVAGFGFSNTADIEGNATSQFAILADQFIVAVPNPTTAGGDPKNLFVIESGSIFMENAFIKELTATKLTAGTIGVNDILIGSPNLAIQGAAQGVGKGSMIVNDGTNDILTMGYLDATTIGLWIKDVAGNTIMKSGVTVAADMLNASQEWDDIQDANSTRPEDGAQVTSSSQFTPTIAWNFDNSLQNWVVAFLGVVLSPAYVTLTSTATDPRFISPVISILGARNTLIRARVRRTAGSAWDGAGFYNTSGHGDSGSFLKSIPDTTILNEWVVLEWDMANLTSGGTDWIDNTIIKIRLDLGKSASDVFDIDWITVGRIGSLADVTADNTAAAITNQTAFATLDKITEANMSTFLASAAIDTAFIKNAAITNAKIGLLAVDAAQIQDLAVTSAKIGNLVVQSAHIENLTVGTGKITDDAIGSTGSISTAASITITSSTVWTTLASVAVTHVTGSSVFSLYTGILLPADPGFVDVEYRIVRDSTILQTIRKGLVSEDNQDVIISSVSTGVAGTQTLKVEARKFDVASVDIIFSKRTLMVQETKK